MIDALFDQIPALPHPGHSPLTCSDAPALFFYLDFQISVLSQTNRREFRSWLGARAYARLTDHLSSAGTVHGPAADWARVVVVDPRLLLGQIRLQVRRFVSRVVSVRRSSSLRSVRLRASRRLDGSSPKTLKRRRIISARNGSISPDISASILQKFGNSSTLHQ